MCRCKFISSLEALGNCLLSALNNASSLRLQQVLVFGKLIVMHLETNSHANSCFLWVCRGRWTCNRIIMYTTFFLWRQSSQKRREDDVDILRYIQSHHVVWSIQFGVHLDNGTCPLKADSVLNSANTQNPNYYEFLWVEDNYYKLEYS